MADEILPVYDVDGHSGSSAQELGRRQRRRAFKAGIISYQNNSITVDCVIRDMNEGGVRLKFEKKAFVPDHFMLTIPIEGKKVDCRVKWRIEQEVGAEFISEMQADKLNVRSQAVDVEYVVPRKSTILKK